MPRCPGRCGSSISHTYRLYHDDDNQTLTSFALPIFSTHYSISASCRHCLEEVYNLDMGDDMSVIFKYENESWKINFSSALWATDKLHEIFSVIKNSFLSDVDFVAETEDFVLFVESKNSNFKEAKHKFKPHEIEKIISVLASIMTV